MTKKATIEFVESPTPIRGLVTKFGGQPVWLSGPQWPVSRETGHPMRFIGQVALDPVLFGSVEARMAYLFMTDEYKYADRTWEPDGGENGLVLQPGDWTGPYQPIAEGPTVYRMVPRPGRDRLEPEVCEFATHLLSAEEPDFLSEDDRAGLPDEFAEAYWAAIQGTKVAGTPGFIQSDEFPGEGYRKLILQLDAGEVPFHVDFGDLGVGYAFMSDDGRSGKFLWQCS
jgi:uncharacterized protein YwqG